MRDVYSDASSVTDKILANIHLQCMITILVWAISAYLLVSWMHCILLSARPENAFEQMVLTYFVTQDDVLNNKTYYVKTVCVFLRRSNSDQESTHAETGELDYRAKSFRVKLVRARSARARVDIIPNFTTSRIQFDTSQYWFRRRFWKKRGWKVTEMDSSGSTIELIRNSRWTTF